MQGDRAMGIWEKPKPEFLDALQRVVNFAHGASVCGVIPYQIPRGCCAAYFPETNVLIPIDAVADKSNTSTSKSIVITVSAV